MSVQSGYEFKPREIIVRGKQDKGTVRARILDRIRNSPRGATCDDLELRLGVSHQTVSAAIRAMTKAGMIVDSGEKRPTRTGRPARVYVRRLKK